MDCNETRNIAGKLRCLFVGMGEISRPMAARMQGKPWFASAGIVDISDASLVAGKAQLGLPDAALFKDLGVALDRTRPDAVIINTPSELHFEQAKASLEAGCHVLVAKPITNDFGEAAELVALAQARGVTLSVAEQARYNRHFTAVADYIRSGALGAVEAAWFMNAKPRHNVLNLARMRQPALYEMACHHFDAFLSVFAGHLPEWIAADGFVPSWSRYAGPCMVNALIRFTGGLHLSYHGGYSSQAPMYEFRLEGSAGALQCHGLHWSNPAMAYEVAAPLGSFAAQQIDAQTPACDAFETLIDHWYAYVHGGAEPPFSGRNNLKSFALVCAAIQSVETGLPIAVQSNPDYAFVYQGGDCD